ncbi:MAG: hypothetical protein CL605_03630 [Altibacter sp.]|nr:hypothetical protein [Altibacter sp.]
MRIVRNEKSEKPQSKTAIFNQLCNTNAKNLTLSYLENLLKGDNSYEKFPTFNAPLLKGKSFQLILTDLNRNQLIKIESLKMPLVPHRELRKKL